MDQILIEMNKLHFIIVICEWRYFLMVMGVKTWNLTDHYKISSAIIK
jgi:hypothetical protein